MDQIGCDDTLKFNICIQLYTFATKIRSIASNNDDDVAIYL